MTYVFRFDLAEEGKYLTWDSGEYLNVREVPLFAAKVSTNKYYFLDAIGNKNIKAIPFDVAYAVES